MNVQIMSRLADFIDNLKPNRFNMEYWISEYNPEVDNDTGGFIAGDIVDISECNTAACVAGWTVALFNGGKFDHLDYMHDPKTAYIGVNMELDKWSGLPFSFARKILDLTEAQAKRLFYCDKNSIYFDLRFDYPSLVESHSGLPLCEICPKDYNDENYVSVDYSSVTVNIVSSVMRRIVSGEVSL